jgi:hypothetical protein
MGGSCPEDACIDGDPCVIDRAMHKATQEVSDALLRVHPKHSSQVNKEDQTKEDSCAETKES